MNVRVTNNMMVRRYMGNMNSSLGKLSTSMDRISSGDKYSRLSESPLDVSRAMRIEESLSKNTQHVKTLEEASSELAAAEDNLLDVIDILSTAYEKSIKAGTGTTAEEDRAVIAQEIDSYIGFLVQTMNSTFNDKFLFSNTNNNTDTAPFEVADDGTVLFNGVDVDLVYKGDDGNFYYGVYHETGAQLTDDDGTSLMYTDEDGVTFYWDDTNTEYYTYDDAGTKVSPYTPVGDVTEVMEKIQQEVLVAESATRYVDAGTGLTFSSDGTVIAASALEVSYGGLEAVGFGTDENGMPENVLSLLVSLRDACYTEGEEFNLDNFGAISDKLIEVKNTTNFYVSSLGTRANFIDKSISRLDDEEYNLTALKSSLVEVDSAEEIIAYKQYEFAWNAILQMGSKIIPTSLMDFI